MNIRRKYKINGQLDLNYLAKFTVAVVCLGVSLSTAQVAAGDTVIRDGNYRVEPSMVTRVPSGLIAILVDHLEMGDGSRILLSEETPLFVIRARRATVGNNTAIVAKGRDGTDAGRAGAEGSTIVVILEEVKKVDALSIVSIGGDGAVGATGYRGRAGRTAECIGAEAGNGRRGGDGGPGGDGGNGGKVFLVLPREATGYGIATITRPGQFGEGGKGGAGGPGGRGKDRCGLWPYWKRGSGNPGLPGSDGIDGQPGEWGMFRTYAVSDFEEETLRNTFSDIISVLKRGGHDRDAEDLRAVIETSDVISD